MNAAVLNLMCPNCAQVLGSAWLSALLCGVLALVGLGSHMASDQQKRPRPESRAFGEPPIGIEPMTYSLRVNRSGRLS
jgi:hypothetical protein